MKTIPFFAVGLCILTLACTPTPLLLDTFWSNKGAGIPLQLNNQGDVVLSIRESSALPEPVLVVNGSNGVHKFTIRCYQLPKELVF